MAAERFLAALRTLLLLDDPAFCALLMVEVLAAQLNHPLVLLDTVKAHNAHLSLLSRVFVGLGPQEIWQRIFSFLVLHENPSLALEPSTYALLVLSDCLLLIC